MSASVTMHVNTSANMGADVKVNANAVANVNANIRDDDRDDVCLVVSDRSASWSLLFKYFGRKVVALEI